MLLILPSDYFRIITKCSDFMIVANLRFLKVSNVPIRVVYIPSKTDSGTPFLIGSLEKTTNPNQFELKLLKNWWNEKAVIG